MNPSQPPEGILDPQQPYWPADKVGQQTWLRLKAKLTGRPIAEMSGERHTSYVKLGDADADRLIENIKKYGQYPQVNQNDKYGGAYNAEAYQKWLVEEFLEKPFRQQVDEKIQDAEINRLREQAQRDKESVSLSRPESLGKQGKVLKEIGKSFKGKVTAESQLVSSGQKIDKTFLEKEVVPVIEPIVEKQSKTESFVVEQVVEKQTEKSIKEPSQTSTKVDDSGIEKVIASGTAIISKDIQKLGGSLDSLVSIQNANLQVSERMVKALNDIKSILLGQVASEKEAAESAESFAKESSLEQSNTSFGSEAYTDTYDTVPGDEEEEGGEQGKGLFGQVVDAVDFVDDVFDISKKFGGKKRKGLRGNRAYGKFRRTKAGRFLGGRFNLARGIRSRKKLSGGAFMASAQPVMVGEAGKEIVTPPKLAAGGLKAGVYDNPTRGNLLPGQAVIPLNRTIGDKFENKGGMKKEGEGFGLAQPLATAMTMPFKAVGGALFGIAASFLPILGPFAGLLKPFLSLIVRPLGKILGVPTQMLDAALGTKSDSREFSFGKILSSIGKSFGIDGDPNEDDDSPNAKVKKGSDRQLTPGKVIQGGNADFWSLAAVSSLEGINPQGEADVAQAVYNRVSSGVYSVNTIKDAVLSPGQFQPVTGDGADLNLWKAIKDRQSAIAAVATHKGKGIATATKYVDEGANSITNPNLQKEAASWVGGRTDFAVPSAANKYPGGFGYRTRHGHLFGWYVGPGSISYGKKNPGPAGVPNFPVKAESGTSTSNESTSSYMIKGPNSGYPIKITTNDGNTTDVVAHGKESVHVGDTGFTILPHENNQWSVSKDPFETFNQWNKVMGSSPGKEGKQYKAASGIVVNDRPWNSGIPLENLKTKSGKNYKVAKSLAPRFKGFVGDLESTGYKIKEIGGWRKAGSGGGSGPPDPDYDKGRYHHPYGASIDINPAQNPYRPDGKLITDFPPNINDIAKKWGLGWGGNWSSSKDTMHFSVGKSEGGVGYDMKTGGELWQGNPVNPGATSDVASSDASSGSETEQPQDPMEALKKNLTDITKNLSALGAVFAGKSYEEALASATGVAFAAGDTTPVATDNPDPQDSVNAASVNATIVQSQPQIVPIPASGNSPAPSVAMISETSLDQMQRIHLSRIG